MACARWRGSTTEHVSSSFVRGRRAFAIRIVAERTTGRTAEPRAPGQSASGGSRDEAGASLVNSWRSPGQRAGVDRSLPLWARSASQSGDAAATPAMAGEAASPWPACQVGDRLQPASGAPVEAGSAVGPRVGYPKGTNPATVEPLLVASASRGSSRSRGRGRRALARPPKTGCPASGATSWGERRRGPPALTKRTR